MQRTSDRLARASSASFGSTDLQSAVTPDLFAYGTLAIDDVISTLIDRIPAFDNVAAHGWRTSRLPGLPYPGLVASAGDVAAGRVYTDLTQTEWVVLDAFEDPVYTLTEVRLAPSNTTALAYVWPDAVEAAVWRPDSLTGNSLTEYLERCKRWRQRHEHAAS